VVYKLKIILWLNNKKFPDTPKGIQWNFNPNCNRKGTFHKMDEQIMNSTHEVPQFLQNIQYTLSCMTQLNQEHTHQTPAKQLLKILRYRRSDSSQWLSIHEVYQQGIKEGLLPEEIQDAIELLRVGGFLEKREDTVRAVPLK
jgi:hypothetical protein